MKPLLLSLLILLAPCAIIAQQWDVRLPNRAVYSVVANPKNPATLYAGNVARTFFKSTDGGTTWDELSIQSFGGSSIVTSLLVVPSDTNIVLAAGLGLDGMDRSTDGGQTWNNVYKDPTGSRTEFHGSTSIVTQSMNSDTLFAIRFNNGVVYRSVNKGATWDSLSIPPGLVGTDRMRTLAVCPDSTNRILAGGRTSYVFLSTNSGKSWTNTKVRLSAHPDGDIANIKWSPTTPGTVYATVQYSLSQNVPNAGLHKSTDYGLTWTRIKFQDTSLYALEVIKTRNGDEIFVGGNKIDLAAPTIPADSIVYRSVDGGTTWQDIGGAQWTEAENGETKPNVWGIAATVVGGNPAAIIGTQAGCFRSSYITSVPRAENTLNSSDRIPIQVDLNGESLIVMSQQNSVFTIKICNILGVIVDQQTVNSSNVETRIVLPETLSGVYFALVTNGLSTGTLVFVK
ncbi:MAG: T9SS type A sorting domain-containing protein [Ignavibacteria bacterium]|nr:T9SS type A sorting domain-containing protein [Ignavibacteria bacterium]